MADSDADQGELHPLCRLDELERDEGRCFHVCGRRIAVFRLEDGVFATDDLCTHGHGFLSEGFVEAGEVECPLHAGRFDIRSGCPRSAPVDRPVATYAVEVVDGVVSVRIPSDLAPT